MSSTNDDRARHDRPWWRNWTTLALLAFIGVLILVRWAAGFRATKRLQVEIDRYRAASQPVYLSDFDPPAVADKDNAALVLKQAAEALNTLSKDQRDLVRQIVGDPDALGQHREDAKAIVDCAKEAVSLVRKARSLPGTNWGFHLTNELSRQGDTKNVDPIRGLARVLALGAIYRHATGDEAEAVELLRDLLVLSKHTDRYPSVIFHLVAAAIVNMTCQSIETASPGLEIAQTGPSSRPASRLAARSQVQALIQELIDQEFHANVVRVLYGERALVLDLLRCLNEGIVPLPPPPGQKLPIAPSTSLRAAALVFAPILDADAVQMLRHTTAQAEAAREVTWPGFKRRAPGPMRSRSGLQTALHPLSIIFMGDIEERIVLLHYRCLAHRRMAATALAIRLYELDHGRRPSKLDDLVPKYLPHVPDDPFSASGGKIGYRPDGKPPVLYSVNLNGIDEEGAFALRPTGDVDWEAKDLPFFLNGDRPHGSPTTTASQPTTTSSRPVE